MTEVVCKVCGGLDLKPSPVHETGWKEKGYVFMRCWACGSDSSTLRADPGWYSNTIQAGLFDWDIALREVSSNVSLFEQADAKPGMTFLDHGTGDGAFMARMRDAGFDVYGFDLCREATEIIADRLQVDRSRVMSTDEQLSGRTFDLVASREVIEHVDDPSEFLTRVAGYVKQGGLLQIQTPLPSDIYTPIVHQKHHVVVLSDSILAAMIERAGFEILSHKKWDIGQCITARRAAP